MNNSRGSIIGNYLNYVGGNAGQAKGMAASGCLNYIVERARYLQEKGFISQEIMNNIASQLPPIGATTINVEAINMMSSNGDQMTQGGAVMIK